MKIVTPYSNLQQAMAFFAGPYSAYDSEIEREYRSAVTVIPSAWALMSAVDLTSHIYLQTIQIM